MTTENETPETLRAEIEQLRQQLATQEQVYQALQTDYSQTAERLRQLVALVENSSDFIGIADFAGQVSYLNPAGRRMVGIETEQQAKETLINNYFTQEDLAYAQEHILPVVMEQGRWNGEFRFRNFATGEVLPVDYTLFVLKDEQTGEPIALGTVTRDISEGKQAAELQQNLVAVIENSSDFIGIATPAGNAIYVNEAGRKMVGLESEEAARQTMIQNYFMPEDMEYIQNTILPAIFQHGRWEGEFRFRNFVTGEPIPVSYNLFAVKDSDTQEIIAISTVSRDITEQKRREQELRTFYALAENAPDGVSVGTLDGVLTYVNTEYQRMSGYGSALIGQNLSGLFDGDATNVATILEQISAQGSWQGVWPFKRKDGTTFPSQMSGFLVRDSAGQPYALGTILHDITEQLRAEAEQTALQEQVIQAQRAALRELSTPLIPLADHVLAMPLVGTIDTTRAQQIMETLLEGSVAQQAEILILDITGIKIVDTQVADAILRTARAANLLGSEVVITGIGPEIAQTLVHLNIDLGGIVTRSTLQSGIAYALQKRRSSLTD